MTFKSTHQAANDQYTEVYTVNIAADGTRSDAVFLDGRSPVRVYIPSGWASTAAQVRVDVSEDNTTFARLCDRYNAEYSVTAAAGKAHIVEPSDMGGVAYIRLVGTTAAGTAAAQTTAVAVRIVARLV